MKTKCNLLEHEVSKTLSRWDREAEISAVRAFNSGKRASLVVYPSGLRVMRFAEPFGECGMHYEVPESTWELIASRNLSGFRINP